MQSIKTHHINMLRDLSMARSPSGFETESVAVLRRYGADLGAMKEDSMNNLYLSRNGNTGTKPMLMLDAHSDEVGFMVQSINPNGTINYLELGGMSPGAFPGHRVWVRNSLGGYIPGIVTSKPPHFSADSPAPAATIDIGARSAEEAVGKFHVAIGEPGVPATDFLVDEGNGLLFGKAFDCRIGCAAVIATLEKLEGVELLFVGGGVYGGKPHKTLTDALSALTANQASGVAFFYTAMSPMLQTEGKLREAVKDPAIAISDGVFHCAGKFIICKRNHPDAADLSKAEAFAKRTIEARRKAREEAKWRE